MILFRHPERGRLLQNIGGIGNCTALPAGADPSDVLAYDTGPGNMIMDAVAQMLSGGQLVYDDSGQWAARGNPDQDLLREMMAHPYFHAEPPKSTGRNCSVTTMRFRFWSKPGSGTSQMRIRWPRPRRLRHIPLRIAM